MVSLSFVGLNCGQAKVRPGSPVLPRSGNDADNLERIGLLEEGHESDEDDTQL